ncbi:hypothetical protein Hanom_Chr16g01491671 [Helianthus anomalus]
MNSFSPKIPNSGSKTCDVNKFFIFSGVRAGLGLSLTSHKPMSLFRVYIFPLKHVKSLIWDIG